MGLDGLKQGFAVVANAKLALAAFGILTVFTFPKSFKQQPTTLVVATVSRSVIEDNTVKMNLSIVVKCLTSQSRQCSHELWKIHWPGLGKPEVKMPDHLWEGAKGPLKLSHEDLQGRVYYELELLKSLQGTDTIVVNVPINGRVVQEDLRLLDVRGLNVLNTLYECRNGTETSDEVVSQIICEETISMTDRLVAMVPFAGF